MLIKIHGYDYDVKEGEFKVISGPDWSPLEIREGLAQMDREIALIKHLADESFFVNDGVSHGGYVTKNVKDYYEECYELRPEDNELLEKLIEKDTGILRMDPGKTNLPYCGLFVLSDDLGKLPNTHERRYKFGERFLYIRNDYSYCDLVDLNLNVENGDELHFNNLVHLLFMVKNAGDGFKHVLKENFKYADHVTILDTGSTDNTIEMIDQATKEAGFYKVCVFQEPFVNFKVSRNRLIDLSTHTWDMTKEEMGFGLVYTGKIRVLQTEGKILDRKLPFQFAFNVMLDDTYILRGDIRNFLTYVRGDDVADSFSIYIKETDMTYSSTRITKPELGLKYKYKIHEIIEKNYNVSMESKYAYIEDVTSDYMKTRTNNRKQKDLMWLHEEYEEDTTDPRPLYYIAETYLCIEDWANAYVYYNKRADHQKEGYNEEKQDALYKAAVMADLHLDIEWEKVHEMYLNCYEYEPRRPEALFMIGKHYNDLGKNKIAYFYLKKAFEIGHPPKASNMNIKTDMYNWHLPEALATLCYSEENYHLGEEACDRYLQYKDDSRLMKSWKDIFYLLNRNESYRNKALKKRKIPDKKLIVFVSPGGWNLWDGETLYTKGLGGSETFSIKYAETLSKMGYVVMVFCNCEKAKVYNGVTYETLTCFISFISEWHIDVCIVNRYPQYLPVLIKNNLPCIYYVMHDLASEKDIIPYSDNIKGMLCISEWHRKQFIEMFPMFEGKAFAISYGIDITMFPVLEKKKYSFMYSSFADRGLYWLLKWFPEITERYPEATLDIFCDMTNSWMLSNSAYEIGEIQKMISAQPNVTNHGWVNIHTLNRYWAQAHVWFYTCHFKETCCLTAYQAAASRTLVISNDLAALAESAGYEKSAIIPGNVKEEGWKILALNKLYNILDEREDERKYIDRNYAWAQTKAYDIVVKDFVNRFIENRK